MGSGKNLLGVAAELAHQLRETQPRTRSDNLSHGSRGLRRVVATRSANCREMTSLCRLVKSGESADAVTRHSILQRACQPLPTLVNHACTPRPGQRTWAE